MFRERTHTQRKPLRISVLKSERKSKLLLRNLDGTLQFPTGKLGRILEKMHSLRFKLSPRFNLCCCVDLPSSLFGHTQYFRASAREKKNCGGRKRERKRDTVETVEKHGQNKVLKYSWNNLVWNIALALVWLWDTGCIMSFFVKGFSRILTKPLVGIFKTPAFNLTPARDMANHRHKKVIKLAKGYRGRANRCYTVALQRVQKARQYAYRDRKVLTACTIYIYICLNERYIELILNLTIKCANPCVHVG